MDKQPSEKPYCLTENTCHIRVYVSCVINSKTDSFAYFWSKISKGAKKETNRYLSKDILCIHIRTVDLF